MTTRREYVTPLTCLGKDVFKEGQGKLEPRVVNFGEHVYFNRKTFLFYFFVITM